MRVTIGLSKTQPKLSFFLSSTGLRPLCKPSVGLRYCETE